MDQGFHKRHHPEDLRFQVSSGVASGLVYRLQGKSRVGSEEGEERGSAAEREKGGHRAAIFSVLHREETDQEAAVSATAGK